MVVHLNRTNHVILYVSPSCSRMMFYNVVCARETKSKTPVLDKSFFISLRIYMEMTVCVCVQKTERHRERIQFSRHKRTGIKAKQTNKKKTATTAKAIATSTASYLKRNKWIHRTAAFKTQLISFAFLLSRAEFTFYCAMCVCVRVFSLSFNQAVVWLITRLTLKIM